MTAKAIVFGTPKVAAGETVRVSQCGRYECSQRGRNTTIVENPARRGHHDYRVLFVERAEQTAFDKLAVYEAERLARIEAA